MIIVYLSEANHYKRNNMERTLLIIKPGAVQRGLIGQIITRLENRGLKLVAMKMAQLDKEILKVHYAHLVEKPFYPTLEASMMAAPVILTAWEGVQAVSVVREMAGATEGKKAVPGTLRGDFCMSHQENVVHTSDSLETAEKELARFFKPEDFFDYPSPLLYYLYSTDEL